MKELQNIEFDKVLCVIDIFMVMNILLTGSFVPAFIIVAHLAYRAFKSYLDSKVPVVIETDLKPIYEKIEELTKVCEEAKEKASKASLSVGVRKL